ncbi:unnamed protein product, partial [marine sediment metagenome]
VGDFDSDGWLEMYSQGGVNGLAASRLPAEPLWYHRLADQGLYGSITDTRFQGLADIDGDGHTELGAGLRKGEFRCYDAANGDLKWSVYIGSPTTDVCAADVDGDGTDEFLFGTENGYLYALGSGKDDPVLWKVDLGAPVGAPIVVDLDRDGIGEILVVTRDGKLQCLR